MCIRRKHGVHLLLFLQETDEAIKIPVTGYDHRFIKDAFVYIAD